MKNPRALITGGLGYIGGNLARHLLSEGWSVTILDSFYASKRWSFIADTRHDIRLIQASVVNEDVVLRSMEGVSVVFHLADRNDYSTAPRHPIKLFNVNVIGTSVVLSMARQAGVDNVIFTSSGMVYGELIDANEGESCFPVDLYSCSKLAAEQSCRYHMQIGMNVKILRLFEVWGGEHSNSLVNEYVKGSQIIENDGFQTRDFIHISDVVNVLMIAMKWEPAIYNIGSGDEISILGLYKLIDNEKDPIFKNPKYKEYVPYRSYANLNGMISKTGWVPRRKISEMNKEEIRRLCF